MTIAYSPSKLGYSLFPQHCLMLVRVRCLILVGLCPLLLGGTAWGIGEVHTSVAAVGRLAEAEERVVALLTEYLNSEEQRMETVRRYRH